MKIYFVVKVNKLFDNFGKNVPVGYRIWRKAKPTTDEEALFALVKIFSVEEVAIEKEKEKSYVTDDYENGVRYFAKKLVPILKGEYWNLNSLDNYILLLGQRHIAYAFYHLLNNHQIYAWGMLMNQVCQRNLYLGLVRFYKNFYGKFSDNEEAIELMCKYYPPNIDLQEAYEDIAIALHIHITNAGTVDDFGYAFNGIELIHQNIINVPKELVHRVIRKYRLYDIIYQEQYRHQIFVLLDGANMEEEEKRKIKFFYLDALIIANHINLSVLQELKNQGREAEQYFYHIDVDLANEKIEVFKIPKSYWNNGTKDMEKRTLWVAGEEVVQIMLQKEKIVIKVDKNSDVTERLNYQYKDWRLECYNTREMEQKIQNIITRNVRKINYKQMTFSLLYLDNYRGLQNKVIDFDHRYLYDIKKKIALKQEVNNGIPHFYGKTVYSLSCIVGRNGTGKTSIVNFLSDTFFKILKLIEDFEVIHLENGYMGQEEYQRYGILENGAKFLVIFRLGDEDYFLTNIEGLKVPKANPFYRGRYQSNNELIKVAYFSQQMRADQQELFYESRERMTTKEERQLKALEGFRRCDYSEAESFIRTRNALAVLREMNSLNERKDTQIVNKELCYQISLMRGSDMRELCEYLGIPEDRVLKLYSLSTGQEVDSFCINDFNKSTFQGETLLKKYGLKPDIRIGYISSGQYAKFTFLAKLHWFIKGCREDSDFFEKYLGKGVFSKKDVLQNEETALIFIDEGDVYYHPEWQRCYIKTLLEKMPEQKSKTKVQIIVTTNSPFFISDILSDDVKYLGERRNDFGNTLGQNIHMLLRENFFMEYTIGEYSRCMIAKIIDLLDTNREETEEKELLLYFDDLEETYDKIKQLIQQIGEPIYYNKLENMLEKWSEQREIPKVKHIRELEKKREQLEMEIRRLKEGKKDDWNKKI